MRVALVRQDIQHGMDEINDHDGIMDLVQLRQLSLKLMPPEVILHILSTISEHLKVDYPGFYITNSDP